ncbi:hypothetical protein [Campylobacter showae]|nr:hypothetical protein [Campylobacter showae]
MTRIATNLPINFKFDEFSPNTQKLKRQKRTAVNLNILNLA